MEGMMRLKLRRRRNAAQMQRLRLASSTKMISPETALEQRRVLSEKQRIDMEIQEWEFHDHAEKVQRVIDERIARGECPIHGPDCPDAHQVPPGAKLQ